MTIVVTNIQNLSLYSPCKEITSTIISVWPISRNGINTTLAQAVPAVLGGCCYQAIQPKGYGKRNINIPEGVKITTVLPWGNCYFVACQKIVITPGL